MMTPERCKPAPKDIRRAARSVFWLLSAIVTVLALYPRLTLPEPGVTEGVTHSYNHILAFASLIMVGSVAWGSRRRLVTGVALGAIALELAQTLSPGRQTTLSDMAASLAGVALGYALVRLILVGIALARRAAPTAEPQPEMATGAAPEPAMRGARPESRA